VTVDRRGEGVSLLVPFRSDNGRREETWNWLYRYWEAELPAAEIVTGSNDDIPFCKTAAVNDAAARATGDVLVILDADCYIDGGVIDDCAASIRAARLLDVRLWYVPYRHFYRLTAAASRFLMTYDPAFPPRFFAAAPAAMMLQAAPDMMASGTLHAHWFGALIQVMPREAFEMVGGMDERFSGWGGEDVSFMHALDTLYGKHKTMPNGVIHLWHPSIGVSVQDRQWAGQSRSDFNNVICQRYGAAVGDVTKMRDLVTEGRQLRESSEWGR
jgi:glycosyltransferase involved in cell wall biosynthesis